MISNFYAESYCDVDFAKFCQIGVENNRNEGLKDVSPKHMTFSDTSDCSVGMLGYHTSRLVSTIEHALVNTKSRVVFEQGESLAFFFWYLTMMSVL